MRSLLLAVISLLLTACAAHEASPSYTPGLGEFMSQLSYRHSKLWFAGQAQNWALAAYELDEIEEGLQDIGHYHPEHHDVKAIPEQIKRYMAASIEQTHTAINKKTTSEFIKAYDAITAGCNACHQANGFGFNQLVKPVINSFANQRF